MNQRSSGYFQATRHQAKEHERRNEWSSAAARWRELGEFDHAAACQRLAEAIRRGDAFRARVAELQAAGKTYGQALAQARDEDAAAHANA